MTKRPAFEGLFYAFFKPGEISENCAPAHAGVRFSRFRGTLKASIFDAFSESARRCPPEGTSRRIFRNFCRFGELFRACFGSFFRTVALPTACRESRGTLLGQSRSMFGSPTYFLTPKNEPIAPQKCLQGPKLTQKMTPVGGKNTLKVTQKRPAFRPVLFFFFRTTAQVSPSRGKSGEGSCESMCACAGGARKTRA